MKLKRQSGRGFVKVPRIAIEGGRVLDFDGETLTIGYEDLSPELRAELDRRVEEDRAGFEGLVRPIEAEAQRIGSREVLEYVEAVREAIASREADRAAFLALRLGALCMAESVNAKFRGRPRAEETKALLAADAELKGKRPNLSERARSRRLASGRTPEAVRKALRRGRRTK